MPVKNHCACSWKGAPALCHRWDPAQLASPASLCREFGHRND